MARSQPGWEHWESDLQELLGLDSTICSGNQFHDTGDAVDNTNPRDVSFPLLVDCKYTEKQSFSVSRKNMEQWLLRGTERGKRAIMAIRVWPRGFPHGRDYVVCSADDFAELLEIARQAEASAKSCCGQHYEPGELD